MWKLSMTLVGALCFFLLFETGAYGQEMVTLTVNSAYGMPVPAVGVHTYEAGTEIAASVASPVGGGGGVRYACVGWKSKGDPEHLDPVGFSNSVTFTITKSIVMTWKWKAQYLLTLNVAPADAHCIPGHIDFYCEDDPEEPAGQFPPDEGGWWSHKSVAQLEAVEHEGYDFAYWSGGSLAVRMDPLANPTAQQMRRPETITAVFTPEPRYFTVASEQGEPVPAVGTYQYYYDDTVNTNCGPNPYPAGEGMQYVCTGYEGTGDLWPGGSETSISFIIHHNSSVTWLWKIQYYLTVGSAHGDPQGTGWYDAGTSVTCFMSTPELYAMSYDTFTEGFETGMSGWTTGGSFDWFLITEDKHSGNYSARSGGIGSNKSTYIEKSFTIGPGGGQVSFWRKVSSRPYYHTLNFYIDGSLYESISGVVGWAESVFSLAAGTRTLRWEYTKDFRSAQNLDRGWIDDITVTNILLIDEDRKYICTGYAGGGGCPSGSGTSVSFTIMESSCLTWLWKTVYRLSVSVTPSDGGTVTTDPLSGDSYYDPDTAVTLTAISNTGYGFFYWSGDLSESENPQSLTMDCPKSVTANFVSAPVADFTAMPRSGSPPLTVQFTDASTGVMTSWAWDFDDDGTIDSTEQNPSYTFTVLGNYTVKLIVTGPGGFDEKTKMNYVSVTPPLVKTWGGSSEDCLYAVAVDSSGNIYCAGRTSSFGAGKYDTLLLKYDGSGTLQWAKTWGGSDYDELYAVAVDSGGSIYCAGYTWSFGEGGDGLFLKYDSSGTLQRARTLGGRGTDYLSAVAVDSDGSIYCAGQTLSFGAGQNDALLLKCDSSGTPQWARTWGGNALDNLGGVAVDSSGNIYCAGYTDSFGAGMHDALLLKYDSSGTLQWAETWGGSGYDRLYAVAVDSSGNIYCTGVTGGDALLLKHSSSGTLQCAKAWSRGSINRLHAVAVDSSGNIYCGGTTAGDTLLLKYDSSGMLAWAKTWGGSNCLYAVAIDSAGSIYLGGYTHSYTGVWRTWTVGETSAYGISDTPSGTTSSPFITWGVSTGTETSPTGSETGAGGKDTLLLRNW